MTNISNINSEDIRLAKPIVLQRLTGIQSANFCHWSQAIGHKTGKRTERQSEELRKV
ncbi:MAG: hypothetical protein NT070_14110 [Cyanobacteria bacterium]|nr:hypothetical protein [Cyanobacteriota bacterium]